MHRIDGPTAAPGGLFTEGDPVGGVPATIVAATWMNDVQEELMTLLTKAGISPVSGVQDQVLESLRVINGPALGASLNLKASLATVGTSITLTADSLVVAKSLSGASYRLPSFSKTVNVSGTGVGGMDTGTAPASGYVGIYAIFNPTTGVSALLAVNATAAIVPEIYGGANMPAGYTASALVAVWPTNASSQFITGDLLGRSFTRRISSDMLTTNAAAGSITALTIATSVPRNAKTVSGTTFVNTTATTAGQGGVLLYQTSGPAAEFAGTIGAVSNVFGAESSFSRLPITSPQTIYYTAQGPVTALFKFSCTAYEF